MTALLAHAGDVLRAGPLSTAPRRPGLALLRLAALVVVFGLLYGAVMGSFGGVSGRRALQPVYSAIKVPLLLLVTFGLSLPSFFVLNTILGVRGDFARVLRGLVASQAALTIVLASLAPMTALWYASSNDYQSALAFNALVFAAASVAAQLLLRRWYRPLVASDRRHRTLMRTWLLIYAFVGIQMGWTLRPFVGNPTGRTTFFRQGAWGNAYVHVAEILWEAVAR